MKYILLFISVLFFLISCNQTTQLDEEELLIVENKSVDSSYIRKLEERSFDSISFKWGEKKNIEVKEDSLLYFTIESPTVLKYYTQTRYNHVDKIEYEGLNILQNKIDSAFHFCFNMNSKKLNLINTTSKSLKSKEWLIEDSLLKQIKDRIPNLIKAYYYKSDTLLILYSKQIVERDTIKHKYKMDLSTGNYPCLAYYYKGIFSPLPHDFDGYINDIYFNDSLGCGFIHYNKRANSLIKVIKHFDLNAKMIKVPFYVGNFKIVDCKYYFGFNHDRFTYINESGEVVGNYKFTINRW